MRLEDALKAVKTVYPWYKPLLYKKRKKVLEEVRALVEGLDNQETQEYVGKVLKDNSTPMWGKKSEELLERALEIVQSWHQWNPQALDIFAVGDYSPFHELRHLEPLKAVAETYKEKFGQESALGFLEGINESKGKLGIEDAIRQLEGEDVQHVLAVAKEYGSDIVYAMSKSLSRKIAHSPWNMEGNSYCEKPVLLLENEDARKIYEAYKDAGRFAVSKIIEKMVWRALGGGPHNFSGECLVWNDENVRAIVKDARNYGKEIEYNIYVAIDRIANNGCFDEDRFFFFQTEAFHGLIEQYRSAPHIFEEITESITSASTYIEGKHSKDREKIMDAFSGKDVEEILMKYKDAPRIIKNIIYGISRVTRLVSAPESLQNAIQVLRVYQERNPDSVNNIVSQFCDITTRDGRYTPHPQAERDLNRFITALAREDVQRILEGYTREWSLYDEKYSKALVSVIAKVSVQEESALPVLTDFLTEIRTKEPDDIIAMAETIQEYTEKHSELIPSICAYLQTEHRREKRTKLSTAISLLSKGSELYEKVKTGEIALKDIGDVAETIEAGGLTPTPYLVAEVYQAPDKQATIKDWKHILKKFADGNFDATDELHRNLEYTRFRRFVDHEKVKKYIKNHFTYESYESIFRNPAATSQTLSDKDQFEIECAAYEAGKLYDFIERVKKQANKIGRKVVVVPNFSYGYLPVSPLVSHLHAEGIETILGVKVGSTECHENKDVMNSRLFKGHRTALMNEQPIMIVVDGTQHLVAREGDGKGARYPDAHQSYLNQVIAMNDALGHRNAAERYVGKSDEDCNRLRATEEYERTVKVYKQIADDAPKQPYQFALWNTAELEMIVRGNRQEAAKVMPIAPEAIAGPTLVFCNVGVPQEQVPEEMREKYQSQEHQPAYFDDSGRIIAFDFGHDSYGVRYLNRLETEVKKAFEAQRGVKENTVQTEEGIPEIVRYLSRVKTVPVEESST